MSITKEQTALINKLRYMGKQYAAGQFARGGGQQKHYLEEAADEIERLAAAQSQPLVEPTADRKDAERYRWLTKGAYIGECFTDAGTILEVHGTDKCVPIYGSVDEAIDAAIGRNREAGNANQG